MIYLPWIAFLLAIFWMIRQGDKAKKEDLRRRAEEQRERARQESREDALVEGLRGPGQGQVADLAKMFGGAAQRKGTAWN
jgi:hypothetical protein